MEMNVTSIGGGDWFVAEQGQREFSAHISERTGQIVDKSIAEWSAKRLQPVVAASDRNAFVLEHFQHDARMFSSQIIGCLSVNATQKRFSIPSEIPSKQTKVISKLSNNIFTNQN